jgi:hypothetical protein
VIPFEKFVVQSLDVNTFTVRTTSPEMIRAALTDINEFVKTNEEPQVGKLMMERCIFIEDAIREKLERESKKV